MRPSSTLPTTWSIETSPTPGAGLPFGSTETYPGRYGPEYSERLTNVWTLSPYVPIVASSTRPLSSSTQCGSATPRAPRWTACR